MTKKKFIYIALIVVLLILSITVFYLRIEEKSYLLIYSGVVLFFSILILIAILNANNRFNLLAWAGVIPLLYNSFGTLKTVLTIRYTTWEDYIKVDNTTNGDYAAALSLLVIYSCSILIVAYFYNAYFQKIIRYIYTSLNTPMVKNLNQLLFVLILIQNYFLISGIVAFSGMSSGQINGTVPMSYALIHPILPFIPFIIGRMIRNKTNIYWLLLFSFEMLYFILHGKRMLLNYFFLICVGYIHMDEIFGFSKKKIVIFFLLIPLYTVLSAVFSLYNGIRNFNEKDLLNGKISVEKIIDIYTIMEDIDKEEIADSYANYSSIRAILSVRPIAIMSSIYQRNQSHLYGEDFMTSLLEALPGGLLINKENNLTGEQLYQERYKGLFEQEDLGNSIPLQGYVDFGIFGAFLYGVLFSFCIILVLNLLINFKIFLLILVGYFSLFFVCLSQGESDLTNMFLSLRVLLFFIVITFFVRSFTKSIIKFMM